jgi:hypothetical protein
MADPDVGCQKRIDRHLANAFLYVANFHPELKQPAGHIPIPPAFRRSAG